MLAIPFYSVIHASLIWGFRVLLFPVLGLGAYEYGKMTVRYFMEFPNDVIDYAIISRR